MTYEEKLAEVVRRLHRKSAEGNIEWRADPGDDYFFAEVGDRVVRIGYFHYHGDDGDPVTDMEIAILDSSGNVLETIRDTTLYSIPLKIAGYSGWFAYMSALYEAARRKVTGAEEAVNTLLEELSDEIPF